MSDSADEWADYWAAAAGLDDEERATAALRVLLASEAHQRRFEESRPNGAPRGRAPKAIARAAAAALLDLPYDPASSVSRRRRILGLMHRYDSPQRSGDDDSELRADAESVREAFEIARKARDKDGILFAGRAAVSAYRVLLDTDTAAQIAEEVFGQLPQPSLEVEGSPTGLWEELLPGDPTLRERWVWRLLLRYQLLVSMEQISVSKASYQWSSLDDDYRGVGIALKDADPRTFARAVAHEATVARRFGNSNRFFAVERRLEELVRDNPDPEVKDILFYTQIYNRGQVNDFGGRRVYNHRRLSNVADELGVAVADPDRMTIAEARAMLAEARTRGSRELLRRMGNDAYALGVSYVLGGEIEDDEDGRGRELADEADEWMDITAEAWSEFGVNGLLAVEFNRVRIAWSRPGRPGITPDEATDRLAKVVELAPRIGLRRNVARYMVTTCTPGDQRVRAALEGLLRDAPRSHQGRMLVALAKFAVKEARSLGDGDPRILELWAEAERCAERGSKALEQGSLFIEPSIACEGYSLAAEAHRVLEPSPDLEHLLELYTKALNAFSHALLHVTSEGERRRMRLKHAPMVMAAGRTIVELGDARAADLLMEAVRRERVGLLLGELSHNPEVSDVVRQRARAVLSASLASPEAEEADSDDDFDILGARSSETIREVRDQAVKEAEDTLGPLAAVVHATFGTSPKTREVIDASPASGSTSMLQLARLDTGSDPVTLARRASWFADGVLQNELDLVELEPELAAASPQQPGYFTLLPRLADALLPPRFRAHLAGLRDAERLMIVPSGMHHVPFDALPVDDERQLVDVAITSVHTSLSSIVSLREIQTRPSRVSSTYVFDTGLSYRDELAALLETVPDARPAESREALEAALPVQEASGSVLAMAVHGTFSGNGWGQSKSLPDKSILKSTDFMSWSVPRLCVLASCHSSIASTDGAELSGFPLAMFLSGATTVVGSLFAVPDVSTGQLMSRFWREYAVDQDAVRAMWRAKHDWFAHDPAARGWHRAWAGLVVYGGAHL